jgi:hypothetical protein
MVMDTNDKQKHKPSPKHTLEEVRKSLEDMVRNEFDDVAPSAQQPQAQADEGTPTPGAAAGDTGYAQSLPRRKPVGIDTEQLLRSLKGLISHELAEAAAGPVRETEETAAAADMEAQAPSAPANRIAAQETPPADPATHQLAINEGVTSGANASGDKESDSQAAADEAEEIMLDALSEADVPEVDLSSEFEGEAELLELEQMAEALAEAAEPSPPPAATIEVPDIELASAEATTATTEATETRPSVQPGTPLPNLKVVDLPYTSGPLKAFAVYDPTLGDEPDIGEALEVEPPTKSSAVTEPAVFVSEWLDELSRQSSYSELGLLEDAEKPAITPTSADLEDELTIDLPAVPPAAVDTSNDTDISKRDLVDPDDKRKPGRDQPDEPVVPSHRRTGLDALEIPGGEQYVDDISEATWPTFGSTTAEDGDTAAQLALDIPEEIELAERGPPRDEAPRTEEEYLTGQGDDTEVVLEAIEPAASDLHSDAARRSAAELTLEEAPDRTPTGTEPATRDMQRDHVQQGSGQPQDAAAREQHHQHPPSKHASSSLALDDEKFVKIPSIDFGSEVALEAEPLPPAADMSAASSKPGAPPDLELEPASPPAAKASQTVDRLSIADDPLLGPSHVQAADDSATIDLDKPTDAADLPASPLQEPPVPPPAAKEKAAATAGGDRPSSPTGRGIIGSVPIKPAGSPQAVKEKPATGPRRDKPLRETRAEKPPSTPKPGPTAFTLTDEPAPAAKMGPAVFKLSDEPAPLPKEPRVPPAATKEKSPASLGRDKKPPSTSAGIIAAVPKKPGLASHAAKEKPATGPRRDKPLRETRAEKPPSTPKPGPTAFTLTDEPAPAAKMGPAVFKISDEPMPVPTGPRAPTPIAKEKPAPGPRRDKPLRETRAEKPPSTPKPGPTAFTLTDEPAPAAKMGPAVFKISDEPMPVPTGPRAPTPIAKEKPAANLGRDKKLEGAGASTHKMITATPKAGAGKPPVKPQTPIAGKSDDNIPVLENAVAAVEPPKVKAATPPRPKVPNAASAVQRTTADATARARSLAVQVVAKLNTELRKCGERALSPATVDRLQYLLREVLERGAAVVDNSRKKR